MMVLAAIVRLLFILGRLVGFAGAVLTAATLVIAVFPFFYHGLERNFGFLPLVVALRFVVAACVVWGVLTLDASTLFRILLIFGVGSFGVLYGWYFLFSRQGLELLAIGDALYLVAGLIEGCALLLLRVSARLGNGQPQ